MKKNIFITKNERKKCKKVAKAYAKLDKNNNIVIIDTGKYGFVKLSDYNPHDGFITMETFTDSKKLFNNLWEDWLITQLYLKVKGTILSEMDHEEIFQHLPESEQKIFTAKHRYFARKAGVKKK